MDGEHDETALRQELRRVETDLGELRQTARQLRQQIGERWFDPTDAAEQAALITAAEEQRRSRRRWRRVARSCGSCSANRAEPSATRVAVVV